MERQELSFEMGARLKSLREEKHLSYQELADALLKKYGIKISKDSLRDYEICSDYRSKAKSLPNLGMRTEYLIALSDFYEVSTDYLLCKTDCPAPEIKIREICEYTGLSEAAVLTLNQWDNPFGAGVILDMFIRSDLSDAILESIVDLRDAYIQCIGEKKAIKTNEHGDPEGNVRNFSSILDIEEMLANYSKKTGREFFLADINDQIDLLHSRISRLWEEFVSSLVYSLDSEDETL